MAALLLLALPSGLMLTSAKVSAQGQVELSPGQSATESLTCSALSSNPADITAYWSASGDAAVWVSPRSYDCGALSPGQSFGWSFTINVPGDAAPGDYGLQWTATCQSADGSPCTGTSAGFTITVLGQTTTTTEQTPYAINSTSEQPTTTTSESVSYSTEQCSAGYHLGGIPDSQNSFVCVPDGLQVDEGGSPTVTPVGDGSLVNTQTGSVVDITCLSAGSCPTGPDSSYLGSDTTAAIDTTTCSTVAGCATTAAQWYQKFDTACQANAGCSQAWDLATSFNDYQEKITEFITTASDEGFLTAGGNTIVALVNGWAWQKAEHALTQAYKFVTTNGAVVPVGDGDPELSVLKEANGTAVYDMKGQAFVESFATNQTLLLGPGQELFIPSNKAQASQQSLSGSVQTFDPTKTSQWWVLPAPNPYSAFLGGALIVAIVALASALVARRLRGRRRLPPPPPPM